MTDGVFRIIYMDKIPVLKIWTDKSFVPAEVNYIPLLYPYWGVIPEPEGSTDKGRYDDYAEIGGSFFKITSDKGEADFFLSPLAYEMPGGRDAAFEISKIAKKYQKKVIVLFNHDSDEDIPIDNAIIFRTSFYKSRQKHCEFAMPGWSRDYMKTDFGGHIVIHKKPEIPAVAYCGYTNKFKKSVKLLYSYFRGKLPIRRFYDSQALRAKAVNYLNACHGIKQNFIIRDSFWGGKGADRKRLNKEFVNNLVESDYALATRGMGNFSYRLYEIMSCGRIPVFIDTDAVLPFDHIVDYRKYFVWLEDRDVRNIGNILLEYHSRITPEDFIKRQYEIRELYDEWISPTGFFKNIWRCVRACMEWEA